MGKALQPVLQAGLQSQLLELLHLLARVRATGAGASSALEHQLLRSLAGMVAASSAARSQLLTAKEPGLAGILVWSKLGTTMALVPSKNGHDIKLLLEAYNDVRHASVTLFRSECSEWSISRSNCMACLLDACSRPSRRDSSAA